MELVHNYQVAPGELSTERIDCFITASGYQKRCTYLAESLPLQNAEKLVITFDENHKSALRSAHEMVFEKLGFNSVRALPHDAGKIEEFLRKICNTRSGGSLNILIDYSCMSKVWYAFIIDFLIRNEFNTERINMFLSYTPKKNNALPVKSKWKSLEPILPYFSRNKKGKPVSLVTGLNSNLEPTLSLIREIRPATIFAFVPAFAHDTEYYNKLLAFNKSFLDKVQPEKIIKYPAHRPDQISSMLTSVCLDQRLDNDVILVPQGPKTFALAAILLSIRYPDIMIMELKSTAGHHDDDEGIPAGEPVIMKSVFCSEEEADDY